MYKQEVKETSRTISIKRVKTGNEENLVQHPGLLATSLPRTDSGSHPSHSHSYVAGVRRIPVQLACATIIPGTGEPEALHIALCIEQHGIGAIEEEAGCDCVVWC